jgi:uncharacterized protein YbjT (DUF2867 family)
MLEGKFVVRQPESESLILVTGATGYVGGRLRRQLEELGYPVRCLVRDPVRLRKRVSSTTQVVTGDVLDEDTLFAAMEGVDTAYYLVHSMGARRGFEDLDRLGAENFGRAARRAKVRRLIYLGGLAEDETDLSPHLRSRHEVGRILRESGVPTIELRASIVLGSGSLSFEMIRSLVERLPIMLTPRWVSVEAQPIAVNDLLEYLVESLDLPPESRVFEIGGADRASYGDLMREYAKQRGLTRRMLPVPVLTPWLSSLWLGLVTPLYAQVGKKLIESIMIPTVINDHSAQDAFRVRPGGMPEAIATALVREEQEFIETSWFDAYSAAGNRTNRGGVQYRNRMLDSRSISTDLSPAEVFAPIRRIGGQTGWYAHNFLWKIRGWLDLLVGGVGVRRGRRDPEDLRVGDALDFWRVEKYEPGRILRLRAEMKVPGRAWLEFEVEPTENGAAVRQTAMFDPEGLFGLIYWYLLYPVHGPVFEGMLKGIVEKGTAARDDRPRSD